MRLGLSWDIDRFDCARTGWDAVLSEAEAADRMGFQSFWIREGRAAAAHCSAPAILLTYLAQKVKNAQLRIAGDELSHDAVDRIGCVHEVRGIVALHEPALRVAVVPAQVRTIGE